MQRERKRQYRPVAPARPSGNGVGPSQGNFLPKYLDGSESDVSRRLAPRFACLLSLQAHILTSHGKVDVCLQNISATGIGFSVPVSNKITIDKPAPLVIIQNSSVIIQGTIQCHWEGVSPGNDVCIYGGSFVEIDDDLRFLSGLEKFIQEARGQKPDRRHKDRRLENGKGEDARRSQPRKYVRRLSSRLSERGRPNRRVVIAGIGAMTPFGVGVSAMREGLFQGKSGVGKITLFDTNQFSSSYAGEVWGFDPVQYFSAKEVKRWERATRLCLCAVEDGLDHGRIQLSKYNKYRVGVVIGSIIGGLGLALEEDHKFRLKGYRAMQPYGIAAASPNACSGEITCHYNLKGPSYTFSQGCSSGASAIALGTELIKNAKVDLCVVGGTDAPLIPSLFGSFCKVGLVAPDNGGQAADPKPYDVNSRGTIISEGASVLILEELDSALSHGHTIYGEVLACSAMTDGNGMMAHEQTGLERELTIRHALRQARISPSDISVVFGHGIGVKKNDISEYRALRRVFRERLAQVPVTSTKSLIGYTQGGCAVLDVAAACLSLEAGRVPPMINTSDPFDGLNVSATIRRDPDLNYALVNCFGFGGKNVSLIIRRSLS